jgi:hypothetical protein
MGLKITTPLHTNKGETSEMYLNIENIMINKQNMNNVMFNKYVSKAAREADANDRCECFEVSSSYMLDFVQGELSDNYVYELIYSIVKGKLEAQGLVVENLK